LTPRPDWGVVETLAAIQPYRSKSQAIGKLTFQKEVNKKPDSFMIICPVL